MISRYALGMPTKEDAALKAQILVWPLTEGVPTNILQNQRGKTLIKHDTLADKVVYDEKRETAEEVSLNGEKVLMDVER